MNILLLIIRVALAAVFGIAALSKLRRPESTRTHLLSADLPRPVANWVAIGLPLVEMGIAVALTLEPSHQVGALAALLLLATFSAHIALQLKRGNRTPCTCFGALTHAPLSPTLLMRNAALAFLAGLLLVPQPLSIGVPIDALAIAALIISVVVLVYWCIQLTRQQGRLLLRIEQLEQRESVVRNVVSFPQAPSQAPSPSPSITTPLHIGQHIPNWPIVDATGTAMNLREILGTPFNILFLDQTCLHCRALFVRLRDGLPAAHTLLFVSGYRSSQAAFAPGIIVIDRHMPEAMRLFGIHSTPAALRIDADGRIASAPITGTSAVMAMLDAPNDHADPALSSMEVPHAIAAL